MQRDENIIMVLMPEGPLIVKNKTVAYVNAAFAVCKIVSDYRKVLAEMDAKPPDLAVGEGLYNRRHRAWFAEDNPHEIGVYQLSKEVLVITSEKTKK
jgi:hypothetical protein